MQQGAERDTGLLGRADDARGLGWWDGKHGPLSLGGQADEIAGREPKDRDCIAQAYEAHHRERIRQAMMSVVC